MKKKITALALVAMFLFSGTINMYAFPYTAEVNAETIENTIEENSVTPFLNVTFDGDLSTSWVTIATDNNFFPATVTVENSVRNGAPIQFRVVSAAGIVLSGPHTVAVGRSGSSNRIPAFSGTYTVEARVVHSSQEGRFVLTITD